MKGELGLLELCELSDMFIGNDSRPIYVASAKTFTVGIFGPTVPEIVSPWTDNLMGVSLYRVDPVSKKNVLTPSLTNV